MSREVVAASAAEYDAIKYGHMTPAMAAAYLQDGRVSLRTFAETLREMYPGGDILPRLTDFFCANGEPAGRGSVQRKIRNWLSGRHAPSSRDDIFLIAYALGLSEQQLDRLLCLCTDTGVQYRDGRDAVFAWFLRMGRSYGEAAAFYRALPPAPGLEQADGPEASRLTHEIYNELMHIQTKEDLLAFYLRNLDRFGSLHLRAYHYFELYLRQLIHPSPPWAQEEERDYSVETVMDTYLSLHMPRGKARRGYSLVQRLIRQNWPNATILKNIRLHKEDVPRKLLLLLYVVTENVGMEENAWDEPEDEEFLTVAERVEDHWWTLNALLTDCGMAPLDPRNATDWLFLYAMCADPDESMSDRLSQVIDHMFEDVRES